MMCSSFGLQSLEHVLLAFTRLVAKREKETGPLRTPISEMLCI